MNILFLSSGLKDEFGGAAISEASLARELALKHSVTVLCKKNRQDVGFSHRFSLQVREFTPLQVFQSWSEKENELINLIKSCDVFHLNGHWYWENYLFSRLCLKYQKPYVLHPRGMLVINQHRWFLKNLFNFLIGNEIVERASKVIALSHYELDQFKRYSLEESKTIVIPNGIIPPEKIETPRSVPSGVTEYFLYLGRISKRKNIKLLVDVFSQTDFKLLLVGPQDFAYAEELKKRINEKKLQNQIFILPAAYEEEKWALLKSAKAVLYPAVDEAFGRVPFETVLMEAFPVLPHSSGSREYLAPRIPFCFYNEKKADTLLVLIQKINAPTPLQIEKLKSAASWVRANLRWDKIADQIQQVYLECIFEKSSLTDVGTSPISNPCHTTPTY